MTNIEHSQVQLANVVLYQMKSRNMGVKEFAEWREVPEAVIRKILLGEFDFKEICELEEAFGEDIIRIAPPPGYSYPWVEELKKGMFEQKQNEK